MISFQDFLRESMDSFKVHSSREEFDNHIRKTLDASPEYKGKKPYVRRVQSGHQTIEIHHEPDVDGKGYGSEIGRVTHVPGSKSEYETRK